MSRPPFLRIPPFPRHRAAPLCIAAAGPSRDDAACDALAAALVAARVGGAFWHPARDPWGDGGAVDAGEAALVAALRGGGAGARAAVRAICGGLEARDPFFGGALDWAGAVALLAGWRALIEANRGFAGIFGIARWKRATMDAMLWDGAGPVRYLRAGDAGRLGPGDVALVWVARAPAGLMGRLAARGVQAGEIEDGFVRSAGLGANCVPPLSVVCDSLGTHIDPARAILVVVRASSGEYVAFLDDDDEFEDDIDDDEEDETAAAKLAAVVEEGAMEMEAEMEEEEEEAVPRVDADGWETVARGTKKPKKSSGKKKA